MASGGGQPGPSVAHESADSSGRMRLGKKKKSQGRACLQDHVSPSVSMHSPSAILARFRKDALPVVVEAAVRIERPPAALAASVLADLASIPAPRYCTSHGEAHAP
ncbi:hypothetical protein RJ55_02253 [Drechmeria coniospora]|nr:hypothetical protein RJ55_02253 [Drechmeria coniospora]